MRVLEYWTPLLLHSGIWRHVRSLRPPFWKPVTVARTRRMNENERISKDLETFRRVIRVRGFLFVDELSRDRKTRQVS